MQTFQELFQIIQISDKEASRKAARDVRKLIYSSQNGRDEYKVIKNIIDKAPLEYAKITEDWRQENFVTAISVMYFLRDRDNQPDFLFPWLFELLSHKNGYIRHASVRMFENEIGPLTLHLRFPGEISSIYGILPDQADHIIFELFENLNNLTTYFWKLTYKKYKYISSLPTGPYKSTQMILSRLADDCGKKYMDSMRQHLWRKNI
jgi:hypothetical protein